MKKVFAALALLLILVAGGASAQVNPYFQVFFPHPDDPADPYFWQDTAVCTPGTMDSLFVVAKFTNNWVLGVEFAINYPAGITWIADYNTPTTTIGATPLHLAPGGISMVWQTPINGFAPFLMCSVLYMCDQCLPDSPISVVPHGTTGLLGYTRYPDAMYFPAIGLTSTFCPDTVPSEDTTWGQVKALFE